MSCSAFHATVASGDDVRVATSRGQGASLGFGLGFVGNGRPKGASDLRGCAFAMVIEPFYFGPHEKQLFGCFQSPQVRPGHDHGVILCYPSAFEYNLSHRLYRQLAVRLQRDGFHTLRFDFYGCGDSAGDSMEARLDQWLEDISSATNELKHRCNPEKICLVGCRLGATLALLAGVEYGGFAAMTLWDPILNGRDYVRELRSQNRRMLRRSHVKPKNLQPISGQNELTGSAFSDAMIEDLEKLDLREVRRVPAKKILLLESEENRAAGQFRDHLRDISTEVCYEVISHAITWDWVENPGQVLVPARVIRTIESWLTESCA